jgi:hypothetical protein
LEAGKFTAQFNTLKQSISQAKVEAEIIPAPAQAVQKPIEKPVEKIIIAKIEVKATREKLLQLSSYLKENGYPLEEIIKYADNYHLIHKKRLNYLIQ